jgi:hypothetical protein
VGEDRDEVACAADQRFEFLAAGRRHVRLVGCSQVALGFRLFGLDLVVHCATTVGSVPASSAAR